MPFKSGYGETSHAFDMFFCGIEHYTRHVLKSIAKHSPDILVTDFAFPAASLAAEIANIPYAVIYHSGIPFRGKGIPPFGSGLPIGDDDSEAANAYSLRENQLLQRIDRRINTARRAFGLPAVESDLLRRPYSPWLNLVTSAECIEAPRTNLTDCTFFIGPCFGKRVEEDFSFEQLRPDKYKIYVSLGTVFNNKPEVFRKIMRALEAPKYQVIVSAGGAYQELQKHPIPKNATVYRTVPQISLLEKIDLFVSHGGNNSINEALAAGKPIIVMPVGGEQGDNASRVIYLGVGKRIDMKSFTEKQFSDAVEAVRNTQSYKERAIDIMNCLKGTQGLKSASQCIAWVAHQRKPLLKKPGFPHTITTDTLGPIASLIHPAKARLGSPR